MLLFVLVVARRVLPPVLEHVAQTCSPELFLLTIIAICFGTAYAVGLAGVSISLGAFLAGLVVSQSRFSEHALSEILPLQILFSATFFETSRSSSLSMIGCSWSCSSGRPPAQG